MAKETNPHGVVKAVEEEMPVEQEQGESLVDTTMEPLLVPNGRADYQVSGTKLEVLQVQDPVVSRGSAKYQYVSMIFGKLWVTAGESKCKL